jgi:hypothetical protein
MNTKNTNIKLTSGEWHKTRIPCMILKHRVLKTDPTYKFVVNADVYVKSNVAVRNNNGSYYYDLLNILAPSSTSVITGDQWLDFLESKYNITLEQGNNYHSSVFPELSFESVSDRDLLDQLYNTLSDTMYSDGLNVFVDFTLQTSGGFIRNKLNIDTNRIKPWIVDDLSLNLLSSITTKDSNYNFKIKNNYKNDLELSTEEVLVIESLLKFNSNLMPNNGLSPYVWDFVNQLPTLSITAKQYLFGFSIDKVAITNILNSDFNLSVDSNNKPLTVITKNGTYDKSSQTINITKP